MGSSRSFGDQVHHYQYDLKSAERKSTQREQLLTFSFLMEMVLSNLRSDCAESPLTKTVTIEEASRVIIFSRGFSRGLKFVV